MWLRLCSAVGKCLDRLLVLIAIVVRLDSTVISGY